MTKRRTRPKITRDAVMFATGLLGVIHETLIGKVERPSLLVLFAGLMGLPAFLLRDEKKQQQQDDEDPPKKAKK